MGADFDRADPAKPDTTGEEVGNGLFVDVEGEAKLAEHPARFSLPIISPAFTGNEPDKHVTVQQPLTAIACWRIPGNFYNFDSTFVRPESQPAFQQFAKFYNQLVKAYHGRPPMTLFGHADPVGTDTYNSSLSQLRALSIFAIFRRDADLWEECFNAHTKGVSKAWGPSDTQRMLASVKRSDGTPFYAGTIDGNFGSGSLTALHDFQDDNGVPRSGTLDKATRAALFPKYFDFFLGDFKLAPEDFLGKGQGKLNVGDFQGCGEFNPVMLFSQDEEDKFKKAANKKERDQKNRRNRRVIAYLFLPGSVIDLDKWPCPNRNETPEAAVKKCKTRFWSDGEARRNKHQQSDRTFFEDDESTFSCRFYHGFAVRSPCEEYAEKVWKVSLNVRGADGKLIPKRYRRCVVQAGDRDDAGVLRLYTDHDGILRIPMFDEKVKMTVKADLLGPDPQPPGPEKKAVDDPTPDPDEDKFVQFTLEAGSLDPKPASAEDSNAVRQRLYDLGYGPQDLTKWSDDDDKAAKATFLEDHGEAEDAADDELVTALRDEFGDDVTDPHAHDEDDLDIDDDD
jgi:Putative peptidoglycan binding domain